MNRRHIISCIAAAAAIFATSVMAQTKPAAPKAAAAATPAQTVKIAYVDPQSGPFAGVGRTC